MNKYLCLFKLRTLHTCAVSLFYLYNKWDWKLQFQTMRVLKTSSCILVPSPRHILCKGIFSPYVIFCPSKTANSFTPSWIRCIYREISREIWIRRADARAKIKWSEYFALYSRNLYTEKLAGLCYFLQSLV